MPKIHSTAQVDPGAEIADDVEIGPYALIGPKVRIGAGTRVGAHVIIEGRTRIGADNRLHPFSVIGGEPQDKKYKGEDTALEIGDRNVIREYCTLHIGTVQDGGITRVGDDNWIMAYVHIAHDCQVGHHTTFANNAQLAGHVHVGDWAVLGGYTGVHQFVRIGAHVMTGISSVILQDVPPYTLVAGNPAKPHGINAEGLRRRGYSPDQITALRAAYRVLYRQGLSLEQARAALADLLAERPQAAEALSALQAFLAEAGRGIVRP
ncbi:MAG TPA: acyl-ACP--UDP-N-acetylglucosamine O-acyltransferase [Thiomonas arsenitoxydans]|jgi:UDP-N-acetylglucosamine acyltransferase|uniref:Acyl-[acyl-carrier-protein]--UDP-N-acetylglucosamine O-acyltransferase n=1 Tax=Thiomonas intermedia (strain K12) TaxID=75379 RepID=D5X3C1_THIK1|nr:acyl-ACP--UDP-N-acetylglucosamine O-acyltransferase [Thiomonas sp.]HOI67395.1 acyl-ACP--UDP-N-acetylglucosamine O-acyltransferase [Thiomonas arsenitoxydans]